MPLCDRTTLKGPRSQKVNGRQLEAFARIGVQRLLQKVLEKEVTALLGQERSARSSSGDTRTGHRNSFGKPHRLP